MPGTGKKFELSLQATLLSFKVVPSGLRRLVKGLRAASLGLELGLERPVVHADLYRVSGAAELAVTVIDLKPAIITQVKTKEKNGYSAVQIGFLEKKAKSANKPEQASF